MDINKLSSRDAATLGFIVGASTALFLMFLVAFVL